MKNIALFLFVGLAALAFALPASSNEGVSAKGVVAALTTSGVSVTGPDRTIRCALGRHSPSLAGYAVGDRVRAQCRRVAKHLVLARIEHLAAPADGAGAAEPVKFGGAITELSPTSITLHDGDRNLTCSLGDGSPSTGSLKVGDHARVVCQGGVLIALAPVTTADAAHVFEGVVTTLGSTSISLQNGEHVFSCALGDGSPSVAEIHVGDRAAVGCRVGSGLLVWLKKLPSTTLLPAPTPEPAPAPNPPHTDLTTFGGTLTALSTASLTVHNDEHGDVTCTLTDGSPHLGDYHVGDHVKMACSNGVLTLIAKY